MKNPFVLGEAILGEHLIDREAESGRAASERGFPRLGGGRLLPTGCLFPDVVEEKDCGML